MKLVDLPFFLSLGSALQEAGTIDPNDDVVTAYFRLFRLKNHLSNLQGGDNVRLVAANHNLKELLLAIESLEAKYLRGSDGKFQLPERDTKASFELTQIKSKIGSFETVLVADIRVAAAFAVTKVGIFDISELVNNASSALAPRARAVLGDATLAEIDAAGRCLGFNLPTACGFHAMRGIERAIKVYLQSFLSAKEIARLSSWGQYLAALERQTDQSQSNYCASAEVITLIRQIKDIYRNPVIHPDRVLSADEAATLFHSAIAASNRIAFELGEQASKAQEGKTGSVPLIAAMAAA